ncbi:hypothetical protein WN55_09974 [Dufourea novaeangliae]|uniref:Uncharacterized protein n=1 Tax=Dufourea novaeangliae TaxID=178035 RepID=A0A154P884_DUFNO|nr:hypothetical protein WN55_09974 [Dufourea novaeangliae]
MTTTVRNKEEKSGGEAHYAKESLQASQRQFLNRWIGGVKEFPWPLHSPDPTLLDFCLWGTLKDKM